MHVHGNGASQLWRPDIYSTGHFVGVRGKGELLVSLRTEQPEELRPPAPDWALGDLTCRYKQRPALRPALRRLTPLWLCGFQPLIS